MEKNLKKITHSVNGNLQKDLIIKLYLLREWWWERQNKSLWDMNQMQQYFSTLLKNINLKTAKTLRMI